MSFSDHQAPFLQSENETTGMPSYYIKDESSSIN